MHRVERGPEPCRLGPIRVAYTPKWVQYYRHGVGTKPTDSRWREFRPDLEKAFHGLCAYCEEMCKGEVEHFRPKSKFPGLVYCWSNWLFACHDCNCSKLEKWPSGGYINPCTKSANDYPENRFTFDPLTGEILPVEGLNPLRRQQTQDMIKDLQLNGHHHLRKRRARLEILDILEAEFPSSILNVAGFRNLLGSPDSGLLSITRVWLSEQGLSAIRVMFNLSES